MLTKKQRLGLVLSLIWVIAVVASAIVFHRLANLALLGFLAVVLFPLRKRKEEDKP